jgi:hypothetical protein
MKGVYAPMKLTTPIDAGSGTPMMASTIVTKSPCTAARRVLLSK